MRITTCGSATVALVLAALAAPAAMGSNLLTDPGFESNPLDTANNVLNNFVTFQGVWGQENSTRVNVDLGITPRSGQWQMRMDSTGGSYTQSFQLVDVTSFAGLIDANNAQLFASAYFNTNAQAAFGGVGVSFFTGNTYATNFGPAPTSFFTLDSAATTWEQSTLTFNIPSGTRWILFQTGFLDNSLSIPGAVGAGFVDDAFLEIRQVPTPGAVALLGLGGLAAVRRRRR